MLHGAHFRTSKESRGGGGGGGGCMPVGCVCVCDVVCTVLVWLCGSFVCVLATAEL